MSSNFARLAYKDFILEFSLTSPQLLHLNFYYIVFSFYFKVHYQYHKSIVENNMNYFLLEPMLEDHGIFAHVLEKPCLMDARSLSQLIPKDMNENIT